jgi:hypothetical protein
MREEEPQPENKPDPGATAPADPGDRPETPRPGESFLEADDADGDDD